MLVAVHVADVGVGVIESPIQRVRGPVGSLSVGTL